MDKKEPQCHTLAAMDLDIYLAMPKRSVAAAPNISYSYIIDIFEYFCSKRSAAYFCIKKYRLQDLCTSGGP